MSRNNYPLDQSEMFDNFNPNRNEGRGGGNKLFMKNDRGGYQREDNDSRGRGVPRGGGNQFSGDRGGYSGGSNFGNNRDQGRDGYQGGRNDRGGYQGGRNDRGGYQGGRNDRGGYQGGRNDRGGYQGGRNDRGGYQGGRNFGRERRDFQGKGRGRGRDWDGGRRDFRNRENFNRRDRRPDYFDQERNDYETMEKNFFRTNENKDFENDIEYQLMKEQQFEKEKFLNDFKKKYKDIIEEFKVLFINEQLTDENIYQIIINIQSNPSLTIFEAMNMIYKEIQIIETLKFVNKGQQREYGPNKDILEQRYEQYNLKDNLKNVIQNYKIYPLSTDNFLTLVPEKFWLYDEKDPSDERRKLIKDESGYFNYLPILNPNGNKNSDENDIYAKNENEILYHYLNYKTIMCKHCDLSDEINRENDNSLCPYAHDILKDFRIIYDFKNEEVCKFMLKLLDCKYFHFENYLNYIPMSLSPEFNLDTFKAHKCLLDKSCPNDYHLCPYYHESIKGDEQRRPPLLFCYSGTTGDICFDENKKKYCPKKCNCGIFCQYLHNKNEYNYHPEHFGKIYKCTRAKVKGKCPFFKTCYGIHSDNSSDEDEEEEEDDKISPEEIEEDENVVEKKKKLENVFSIAKIFRCRKCQKVSENAELCCFIDCKHFMCVKCFKKLCLENKKKNKKNKEEILLSCPFCEKELKKGEVNNAYFDNLIV